MATVSEQLSDQFYRWELRGRGWRVFAGPVDLEPPFQPFSGHYLSPQPRIDDGLRPTALSSFWERLTGGPKPPPLPPVSEEDEEPEAVAEREDLVELQVALPAELDIKREAFEEFLGSLHLCRGPVTFEMLGTPSRIMAQFAVHRDDAPHVRQELQAFFPDAVFLPAEGTLEQAWTDGESAIVEFGLGKEFMLPLASGRLDPFVGITGALAELGPGELGLLQVMFQPARHPWGESVMRAVTDDAGKPFFANAPDLTRQAEKKTTWPLHAVVARIATQSGDFDRAWEIAENLAGSLRVFALPAGNELIPLKNDEYPYAEHVMDVLRRQSRRSGMLLNTDELVGFVHLPSSAVRSAKLQRQAVKTKPAPEAAQGGSLLLGHNVHAGKRVPVALSPEQRVRHCHMVGASGTGKSTLLYNLIKQDIESGQGLALLDPHGDFVDRVLGSIPEGRIKDVVLLDPSDEEYSVGFNFLSAHSELEKRLLASDLVSVFQRLSTSWGDQMASVLNNSILAFLESDRGGTLADLRRFLLEPAFRAEFLQTVSDPEVQYYWHHAFPQLSGNKSIGPVLTRLETFLSPKSIRYMVSQKENKLDFGDILDTGKIFLARLSQGLIGRENSYLLGTLLVAKFQQLAMSRQAQAAAVRKDFWLYIDEFQNFITPSMAEILSGARKYRIGLILAHQDLRQLQRDPEVASAVLSNPYTRIVFRVGDDDARKLADGFASFEARDLQSLGTGEAVCRIERSDWDCNLTVPLPQEVDAAAAQERRNQVIAASRQQYGTPRVELEAALRQALAPPSQPAVRKAPPAPPAKEPSVETKKPAMPPPVPEAAKPAVPAESKPDRDHARPFTHDELKRRICREAERLDYTVACEMPLPAGCGQVDLALQRGDVSIACEISVKNDVEYEAGNVKKRLEAGFHHVAMISEDPGKLEKIRAAVAPSLAPEQAAKIGFYLPDAFIAQLRDRAARDPAGGTAERGKPRKRAINLGKLSEVERKEGECAKMAAIAAALKRNPSSQGSGGG